MQLRQTPAGVHGWFLLQDGGGSPLVLPPEECRVAVVSPDDKRCFSPVVHPGRQRGMYFFQVPSTFLAQPGDYTVGMMVPRHRVTPLVRKFHVVH